MVLSLVNTLAITLLMCYQLRVCHGTLIGPLSSETSNPPSVRLDTSGIGSHLWNQSSTASSTPQTSVVFEGESDAAHTAFYVTFQSWNARNAFELMNDFTNRTHFNVNLYGFTYQNMEEIAGNITPSPKISTVFDEEAVKTQRTANTPRILQLLYLFFAIYLLSIYGANEQKPTRDPPQQQTTNSIATRSDSLCFTPHVIFIFWMMTVNTANAATVYKCGKPITAWYAGDSINIQNSIWTDKSGNGHDAEIKGEGIGYFDGSVTADEKYLNSKPVVYGSTLTKINFGVVVKPANTIFNLCKYRNVGTKGRILGGTFTDLHASALYGFWRGYAGVAYSRGWITHNNENKIGQTKWILSSQTHHKYRANFIDYTLPTWNGVSPPDQTLNINDDAANRLHGTEEPSDFACAEIIVFADEELELNKIKCIEDYFRNKYKLTGPTNDPTRDPTRDPTSDPTGDPTRDPTRKPIGSGYVVNAPPPVIEPHVAAYSWLFAFAAVGIMILSASIVYIVMVRVGQSVYEKVVVCEMDPDVDDSEEEEEENLI